MGMETETAIKLETKMKTLTAVGCAPLRTSRESISLLLLKGIFQRGERVAFWGGEALFPKGIFHGGIGWSSRVRNDFPEEDLPASRTVGLPGWGSDLAPLGAAR